MICIDIHHEVKEYHFWQREKIWSEKYEHDIVVDIVEPINKMIEDYEKHSGGPTD